MGDDHQIQFIIANSQGPSRSSIVAAKNALQELSQVVDLMRAHPDMPPLMSERLHLLMSGAVAETVNFLAFTSGIPFTRDDIRLIFARGHEGYKELIQQYGLTERFSMADDTKRQVKVAFRGDQERLPAVEYLIAPDELDRLVTAFKNSPPAGHTNFGVFDVTDGDGQPRKLMLRFSDVLYIG